MGNFYGVGLHYQRPVTLDLVRSRIRDPTIKPLRIFLEDQLLFTNLLVNLNDGNNIWATAGSFTYLFQSGMDVERAIRKILNLAKLVENEDIIFNPNLLTTKLGPFATEDEFRNFSTDVAANLQRRLYLGGGIGYSQASTDWALYFGTPEEIGEKQGLSRVRKLELPLSGIAQPASLDELLTRLRSS